MEYIKFEKNKIEGQLTLLGYEEDGFVYYSPSLDLFSSGDDEEEALQSMRESISLFFAHLLEEKTLALVMRKLGWRKNRTFKDRQKFKIKQRNPVDVMGKRGISEFKVKSDERLALAV